MVGEDKWQKVRIEFEYESRNFLKHMHEASDVRFDYLLASITGRSVRWRWWS